MTLEQTVARHYGGEDLMMRIDRALRAAGLDPDALSADDLKPLDEFHTGGLEATMALIDQIDIEPRMRVLDIGCGLGGTARHILHRYGAAVVGVDVTSDFVAAGRELNTRTGLSAGIDLHIGSATALPEQAGDGFDLAVMFHVGMNVADKPALFAEAARVLRPGGHFALFDVMATGDAAAMRFPVPWAAEPALSHVAPPKDYRDAARAAGFTLVAERDRKTFTLDYFTRVFSHIEEHGLPPLGIHILMGDTAAEKLSNYVANVTAGHIAPSEMIFRRA